MCLFVMIFVPIPANVSGGAMATGGIAHERLQNLNAVTQAKTEICKTSSTTMYDWSGHFLIRNKLLVFPKAAIRAHPAETGRVTRGKERRCGVGEASRCALEFEP